MNHTHINYTISRDLGNKQRINCDCGKSYLIRLNGLPNEYFTKHLKRDHDYTDDKISDFYYCHYHINTDHVQVKIQSAAPPPPFSKDQEECPICFENMVCSEIAPIPCKHKFHTKCLKQISTDECPLCRQIMGINEARNLKRERRERERREREREYERERQERERQEMEREYEMERQEIERQERERQERERQYERQMQESYEIRRRIEETIMESRRRREEFEAYTARESERIQQIRDRLDEVRRQSDAIVNRHQPVQSDDVENAYQSVINPVHENTQEPAPVPQQPRNNLSSRVCRFLNRIFR